MKTKIGVVILSSVLFGFQSAKRTDFSGMWRLDLKHSVNLPESFKHVDTFTMEVRQTRDSIITLAQMTGNNQDVKFPLTSYALNGSEVFREDAIRKSKRWNKCSWMSNGRKLIVNARVEQRGGTSIEKYTQRDVWELVDSNTLQISVSQKSPRGAEKHSERRILHRVR